MAPKVSPPLLGDAGVDQDELILAKEHTDENNNSSVKEAEHPDIIYVGMAAMAVVAQNRLQYFLHPCTRHYYG
jgi:hypothetical protein